MIRRMGHRIKGDEHILGDSDFVDQVLKAGQNELERKSAYRRQGYDFDWLVDRVAAILDMTPEAVRARSSLLYWAHRK